MRTARRNLPVYLQRGWDLRSFDSQDHPPSVLAATVAGFASRGMHAHALLLSEAVRVGLEPMYLTHSHGLNDLCSPDVVWISLTPLVEHLLVQIAWFKDGLLTIRSHMPPIALRRVREAVADRAVARMRVALFGKRATDDVGTDPRASMDRVHDHYGKLDSHNSVPAIAIAALRRHCADLTTWSEQPVATRADDDTAYEQCLYETARDVGKLLASLVSDVPGQVVIVPSGVLRLVPIGFPLRCAGRQCSVLPAMRLIRTLRESRVGRPTGSRRIALVDSLDSSNESGEYAHLLPSFDELRPLKWLENDTERLLQLFAESRRIHVAAHGYSEFGIEGGVGTASHRWSAELVKALQEWLPTESVVLMTCWSAPPTSEVLLWDPWLQSFPGILLAASVPQVVATHWRINHRTATMWETEFYRRAEVDFSHAFHNAVSACAPTESIENLAPIDLFGLPPNALQPPEPCEWVEEYGPS